MESRHEQLVGRQHVEHSPARDNGLVLVIIHFKMPFGPLYRHHVVSERIGRDHEPSAVAFYVESHQPG